MGLNVVTLDMCVRTFSRFMEYSLGEAIKCLTINPAWCLGIENWKGTLRPGADADWSFLIGAGMYSAHGSRERKNGRKNEGLVHEEKN